MKSAITRFGPQACKASKSDPRFYECGICGCYHPAQWDGDCRDNANRFHADELDAKGPWVEVEMPT